MPRGQNPNSKKALKEHQKPMNSERQAKAMATKARTRAFKEELNYELAQIVKDKNGSEATVKSVLTKQLVQQALRGNLKAWEIVRDTIGEKPAENIIISEVDPAIVAEVENMVYDTQ